MTSIYDFSLENQNGEEIPLSHYQGKVLIVVNTATGCGLTPQYQGLQDLYLRYQEKGFEILDIPCNQFMGQAPGTAEEINSFCSLNYRHHRSRDGAHRCVWLPAYLQPPRRTYLPARDAAPALYQNAAGLRRHYVLV